MNWRHYELSKKFRVESDCGARTSPQGCVQADVEDEVGGGILSVDGKGEEDLWIRMST